MPTVVVGGGWAGIAAATSLALDGIPVTLVEAARALGGRARDVASPLGIVDNGQHLMIGAYGAFLGLLARLGVAEEDVLTRRSLTLAMSDLAGGTALRLAVPALPAPLHLAKALTTARGLGLRDRLAAVKFVNWLQRNKFEIDDVPLGALLDTRRQPRALVRGLWEPLCLATLNTPLAIASGRLFARVLGRTFTGSNRNCDLLLPRESLGSLLPARAAGAVERAGGRVLTGSRVAGLVVDGDRVRGVRLADGGRIDAADVVVAVPPDAACRLFAATPTLAPLVARMDGFATQPIATVYLRYPPSARIATGLHGVLGGTTQWLFDRGDCGTPGVIAAVISAAGPHEALDRDALAARVAAETARVFPTWPPVTEHFVVREKRATFASVAGIDALRPGAATPLTGCWLAGDWTATGLPATLEGAVQSGLESARALVAARACA